MTKDTVIIMTLLESSNSNSNFFRRIVFRSFFVDRTGTGWN